MSPRIVFNGREYDGLESMAPEVRAEYERILGALGPAERGKIEAALGHARGLHFNMNVSVHTKIRVNGQDYDSVDAMPADVRAIYERALTQNPSAGASEPSLGEQFKAGSPLPKLPPAIDAEDTDRAVKFRRVVLAAGAAALLAYLLLRR